VRAKDQGYTQVLWLDARELKALEEAGTMNIMLKIDGRVITPPLSGSILPGITRDAVITILKEWNIPCDECTITIDDVVQAAASGKLEEMFGTGTAAVISPVGELKYRNEVIPVNHGQTGPLAQRLFDYITGLQYGTLPDNHGWVHTITPA
jgi:branched-chain amino acid aminotransferase